MCILSLGSTPEKNPTAVTVHVCVTAHRLRTTDLEYKHFFVLISVIELFLRKKGNFDSDSLRCALFQIIIKNFARIFLIHLKNILSLIVKLQFKSCFTLKSGKSK